MAQRLVEILQQLYIDSPLRNPSAVNIARAMLYKAGSRSYLHKLMHDSFNSCLLYIRDRILGFDNTASPLSKMTVDQFHRFYSEVKMYCGVHTQ
jgi:hypothetical protein